MLFSHLATAVLVFVPQVDLAIDPWALQAEFPSEKRHAFRSRLAASVDSAFKNGTTFEVHIGSELLDKTHIQELVADLEQEQGSRISEVDWNGSDSGRFRVKTHPVQSHGVALALKEAGQLAGLIKSSIEMHAAARRPSR